VTRVVLSLRLHTLLPCEPDPALFSVGSERDQLRLSDVSKSIVNFRLSALVGICLVALLHAQTPTPTPGVPPRTPETLDQLLGPIALYPDALVALILPAATVPTDIVLAARYLDAHGDPAGIDAQAWDESVKALAHYPEVVRWMDANLEWTRELGAAFLDQPADVMNAVQRLRRRAQAAGALTDTPQQSVVVEGDGICIVPTQPDVIYVPEYDPALVYFAPTPWLIGPRIFFRHSHATGGWLHYDCDWGRSRIWVGQGHREWNRRPEPPPRFAPRRPEADGHPWQPDPHRPHPVVRPGDDRAHPVIARPRPIGETPPSHPGPSADFRFRPSRPGEPPPAMNPPPAGLPLPPRSNVGHDFDHPPRIAREPIVGPTPPSGFQPQRPPDGYHPSAPPPAPTAPAINRPPPSAQPPPPPPPANAPNNDAPDHRDRRGALP
jgi:hypothetical protein